MPPICWRDVAVPNLELRPRTGRKNLGVQFGEELLDQ